MTILVLFTIFLMLILVSYSVGNVFVSPTNNSTSIQQPFLKILLGTLIITVGYALLKSGFTSFYTVILIPIIIYCYQNKNQLLKSFSQVKPFQPNRTQLITTLGTAIIAFIYWSLYTFDYSDFSVKLAYYDFHFYAEVANGMAQTGTESLASRNI